MTITLAKGKPFGQHEKITKRIKGLMRDYAGDVGIVKELLQNSDDAHASKFEIILDEGSCRPDTTEETFDKKAFSTIYGPSIIVFDDGDMTEQDVESIQEISSGNKVEDPCNTGKFGLGFNSVYHITKTPILISKGAVNVFDSWELLCDWTVNSQRPGRTYESPECRKDFASLFTRLDEIGLSEEKRKDNTIFILPLIDDYIAEIANGKCEGSADVFTVKHFQDIVTEVKNLGEELLLFLNNVNHLTIRHINTEREVVFSLTISRSGDDVKEQQRFISKSIVQFAENPVDGSISSEPCTCKHNFEISEHGESTTHRSWYVSRKLCLEKNLVQKAKELKGESAIPIAGAAVSDLADAFENEGTLFCGLPLPPKSRTSLNIDGRWDLDHSRRHLTQTGSNAEWNKLLITHGASAVAACLISQRAQEQGDLAMRLLPSVDLSEHNVEDVIPKEIYRHISELPLIPCGQSGALKAPIDVRCLPECLEKYRNELISYGLENIPVRRIKPEVKKNFRNANCALKNLEPSELRDILRTEKWNDVKIVACTISLLNKEKKVQALLQFCLSEVDSIADLDKLPLALKADGVLTTFDNSRPLWLADQSSRPLLDCAVDVILNDEISKIIKNGLPSTGDWDSWSHTNQVPAHSLDHQSVITLLIDRGVFQQVEEGASIQRSCLKQDDEWLSKFFNYLDDYKGVSSCLTLWLKNIPIIPDQCGELWPLDYEKIVLIRPRWGLELRKRLCNSLSTLGLAVIDNIQKDLHVSIFNCRKKFNIDLLCPESLVEIIEPLDSKCFKTALDDGIANGHVLLDYFVYCFESEGEENDFNVEKLKSLPLFETSEGHYRSLEENNAYYPAGSSFAPPNIHIDAMTVLKYTKSWKKIFQELGIQELTIARYTVEVLAPEFHNLTQLENKSAWEFIIDNWQDIKSGLESEYEEKDVESLGEKLLIQCEVAKCHTCDSIHDEVLVDLKDVFPGAIYLPDYDFYKHDKNDFVGVLRKLGMSSRLKPVVVMSALNKIIESCEADGCVRQVNVDSIERIFNYIFYNKPEIITEPFEYDGDECAELSELLSEMRWLPILDAPPQDSGFPKELMPNHERRLFKIEEIYLKRHWRSVISTSAVLAFDVGEITEQLKGLGFKEGTLSTTYRSRSESTALSDVASHLINLVNYCDCGRLPLDGINADAIKHCLNESYRTIGENYPEDVLVNTNPFWTPLRASLKSLRDSHCILDEDGEFWHPSKVVLKTAAGLSPWFKLIEPKDKSIKKCFGVLGSKPEPGSDDAESILCEMREKYDDDAVDTEDHTVAQRAFQIIGKETKQDPSTFPAIDGLAFAIDHSGQFGDPNQMLINDSETRNERLSRSARWFLKENWTNRLENHCSGFGITRSNDLLERHDDSSFIEDDSQAAIAESKKLEERLNSNELFLSIERLFFHYTNKMLEPIPRQELRDLLHALRVHPSKGQFYTSLFWPSNEVEIKNTRGKTSSCSEEGSLYIDFAANMKEIFVARWVVSNIGSQLGRDFQAATPEIQMLMFKVSPNEFSSALNELNIKTHPEHVSTELVEESNKVDYHVPDDHASQSDDSSVDETVAIEKGAASDIEVKKNNDAVPPDSKQEGDSEVDHHPKIPIELNVIAGKEVSKQDKPGEERSNTSSTNTDLQKPSKVSREHANSKGSHKGEKVISPGSAKTYSGPQQQKPVYVGGPNRTRSEGSSKAVKDRNKETELAAVNAALKNEADKGRYAIDVNKARSDNKGYDLESWDTEPRDKDNPPEPDRYIEVKGTKNPWKEFGVGVTTAQHHCGIEKGPKFWLYVVEKANQPEQKLYKIQNPVGQITEYMFNGSWAQLGR